MFVAFDLSWLDDDFVMHETFNRRRERVVVLDRSAALVVVASWDGAEHAVAIQRVRQFSNRRGSRSSCELQGSCGCRSRA